MKFRIRSNHPSPLKLLLLNRLTSPYPYDMLPIVNYLPFLLLIFGIQPVLEIFPFLEIWQLLFLNPGELTRARIPSSNTNSAIG